LSERDGNEDQKGTAVVGFDMNCWRPGCESKDNFLLVYHNLAKIGDGTRLKNERVFGYGEGKIVRGHIKLFTLQMNLDRSRQPKNAAMTEKVCFRTCQDAASSMQRIYLPSLKIVSGR
jgi:hypothetical protein